MESKNAYLMSVLKQTPRLLGLQDRNVMSKTYGCFDRQYWHYNICDTPAARCQESCLTLLLLYLIDNELNVYRKNNNILAYSRAAIEFWKKIQNKNGSFNEWYPNESSFVASAFTLYAVTEYFLLVKKFLDDESYPEEEIIKTAEFLINKDEGRVLNQQSGAAIALYNVYLLTGKTKYKEASEEKIEFICRNQKGEGWFDEYGGPDIGYLSLMIDYLSKYFQKNPLKDLADVINKAVDFISYFLFPDFSAGGIFSSRNTEYLIPHGFEIISGKNARASAIKEFIRKAIKDERMVSLYNFDDRYLSYIAYTYLQAYLEEESFLNASHLPYEEIFDEYFDDCGIKVYSNRHYYLITNLKKGGTFKAVFKSNEKSLIDSGIMGIDKNGEAFSSGVLNNDFKCIESSGKIETSGKCRMLKSNTMSPEKNIALRIFQLTAGRSERVGLFMKEKLRDKLITSYNDSSISFNREISTEENFLIVRDEVSNPENIGILFLADKSSDIYVPSSRYFINGDLSINPITIESDLLMSNLSVSKRSVVVRKYDFKGDLVKFAVNGKEII
ncbi:MAG: hypothetical protein D6734_04895 [Candidatus Schekmanbacteria bacterium]|nr:MAG: hypothetical protein D6734_04895 [Candidatus Schekmanbacteria bacterium]